MTGHEDGRLPDVEIERILSAGFAPHVPKSIGGSSIRWADRFPGTATAPQDGELPGSEGRYRVGCEIGRGGIGIVYEGQDRDLLREVALKVLRPDRAASADLERRFLREARIECFLDHPGVVPVYDMGEAARKAPFFAMKLVRGRPLSALLAERDSPGEDLPGLLRVWARQAADPLVVFQLALRKDFHRSSRFAVARLALDPGLPVAWAACASALQKTGDLDLAERLCRRSLSMADPSPFEHRVLFEILNGRGRKEEAAEAFRRGVQAYEEDLREHPANAERIIQFARFHRDCGRMEDAVSVLTRGIEAAPDQAVLRYELAGRLTELGRPAEALPLAEEALARMPERYRARNLLRVAAALRALGRRDAATEHWREVLLLEPHNAEVHVALAGDEFQLGDFAAAEVRLRAVVEREPEYVRARDNLIYYTALAGDPDAALRMANEWMAEGLFPRRVLVSLGIAHVRAGRFEEAIRPIEETCKAMGVRDRFLGLALVAVWGRSDPERAGNARALYDRIVETPAVDSLEYRVLRGLAEEALGIAGAK
jgi:tetratricopeptide (TPR) repeat protein